MPSRYFRPLRAQILTICFRFVFAGTIRLARRHQISHSRTRTPWSPVCDQSSFAKGHCCVHRTHPVFREAGHGRHSEWIELGHTFVQCNAELSSSGSWNCRAVGIRRADILLSDRRWSSCSLFDCSLCAHLDNCSASLQLSSLLFVARLISSLLAWRAAHEWIKSCSSPTQWLRMAYPRESTSLVKWYDGLRCRSRSRAVCSFSLFANLIVLVRWST